MKTVKSMSPVKPQESFNVKSGQVQLKDVEYLTKSTTRRKLYQDEIFMAMSIDD